MSQVEWRSQNEVPITRPEYIKSTTSEIDQRARQVKLHDLPANR